MPDRIDGDAARRRRNDYDRDKQQHHHHHHRSSPSSSKLHLSSRRGSAAREPLQRPASGGEGSPLKKLSMTLPEMDRRSSSAEMRPQTSYPTFSKAHSREAVGSREDIASSRASPLTSDTGTPLAERLKRRSSLPSTPKASLTPPPPGEGEEVKRSGSANSVCKTTDGLEGLGGVADSGRRRTEAASASDRDRSSTPRSGVRKDVSFRVSEVSSMPGAFPDDFERKSTPTSGYRRTISTGSQPASSVTDATTDSDATSVAADRKPLKRPSKITLPQEGSLASTTDSQPSTPTLQEPDFQPPTTKTHVIDVERSKRYVPRVGGPDPATPKTANYMPQTAVPFMPIPPPPPPPPPPPTVNTGTNVPRVDYLLKNGGLPSLVSRRLIQVGPQVPIQQYSSYASPGLPMTFPREEYAKLFTHIHTRLDDYVQVLRNSGSLAVATGYKSVARRLLDKLSQVFARDISSQRCDCVLCRTTPQPTLSDEEDSGVSWGEILEFVSGRRELPQWPPFTIEPDDKGPSLFGMTQAPMQKLDIDVPDEYRDHYIRQNQKTKKAVQNWLALQPEYPTSPPDEADEDTLMFAMMTKLDVQQRNFFIALMHGQSAIAQSRAPTPAERPPPSDVLRRARQALQRLYRLDRPPRDCESAMYLLKNPHLHGMLATLAEVNEQEWDILVSGRFDGFLWSGAESPFPPTVSQFASPAASRVPSRGPNAGPSSRNPTPFSGMSGFGQSRNTTPFSPLRNPTAREAPLRDPLQQEPTVFPSRGPTPGLGVAPPAPVQLDEDTEIAVLGEVERNLYADMERYEDAFEVLHARVERVRELLRERSTGLAIQAQRRRGGSAASAIGVRLDTPASGYTNFAEDDDGGGAVGVGAGGADDDDGLADLASLAPDDSASQIDVGPRMHRPRRERRTPAPIGEDVESLFEEDVRRPSHGGRRSKY